MILWRLFAPLVAFVFRLAMGRVPWWTDMQRAVF